MLAGDHPLLLEGLAQLFGRQDDMVVGCRATGARDALTGVARGGHDLVVLGMLHREIDLVDLVKDLRYQCPSAAILVVSMLDEIVYAQRLLEAGAKGYILVDAPVSEILRAAHTVLSGETYLSRKMCALLLDRLASRHKGLDGSPLELLTDRELHVFQLIGSGVATGEIAGQLGISPKTVETYRERIKDKFHLHNGSELLHQAIGWVEHAKVPELPCAASAS